MEVQVLPQNEEAINVSTSTEVEKPSNEKLDSLKAHEVATERGSVVPEPPVAVSKNILTTPPAKATKKVVKMVKAAIERKNSLRRSDLYGEATLAIFLRPSFATEVEQLLNEVLKDYHLTTEVGVILIDFDSSSKSIPTYVKPWHGLTYVIYAGTGNSASVYHYAHSTKLTRKFADKLVKKLLEATKKVA